jgi:hypothetical protein
MIYIAQDVPWYMIDTSEDRPWRDEDVAMSAPRTLGKYDTRLEAALKLAAEFEEVAGYRHVQADGEDGLYRALAEGLRACAGKGFEGVRIHGRYYRIVAQQ